MQEGLKKLNQELVQLSGGRSLSSPEVPEVITKRVTHGCGAVIEYKYMSGVWGYPNVPLTCPYCGKLLDWTEGIRGTAKVISTPSEAPEEPEVPPALKPAWLETVKKYAPWIIGIVAIGGILVVVRKKK